MVRSFSSYAFFLAAYCAARGCLRFETKIFFDLEEDLLSGPFSSALPASYVVFFLIIAVRWVLVALLLLLR